MSRPILLRLLIVMLLLCNCVYGQNSSAAFSTYISGLSSFNSVNLLTQERYLVVNPLPDSLNVSINATTDLQEIINKKLQHKVYAVEIQRSQIQDLAAIFHLLVDFKNLTFLKLSDPVFPNEKDMTYQIPQNIDQLQQLKAFEVSFTNKLDVDDALDKLKTIKQLNALAIKAYNHPVVLGLNKLPQVKYVALSSTNLQGVDVSQFTWETLLLSGSLPNAGPDIEVLSKLSGIKTLNSLELKFYTLGDAAAISQLKNLSALGLNFCNVSPATNLFSKLSSLKKLTNLSVSLDRDSIQTVKGIEQLGNLQYLRLSIPSFEKQPEQLNYVQGLKNLQSLSLYSSKLKQLPDIFARLTQLKRIRLDGNQLEELPAGIFSLPNLEYLNALANKLRQLPTLKQYECRNIKTLSLSYNELTTLPQAITLLNKLQILDVSANKLKTIHGEWQGMMQLKEVSFQNNKLTIFPTNLQLLSSLEKMDVSNNEITVIPDISISKAYNLRSLNISNNHLIKLPDHIGRYSNLEILQAEGNWLSSVPESLGDCKNIKLLDFNSVSRRIYYDAEKSNNARFAIATASTDKLNHINELPGNLKYAKQLTSINLEGNPELNSKAIFDILLAMPRKNLRVNLRNTNITELPNDPRWADLTIFQLNLSNNQLKTLPAAFANVNNIYEINLAGNPLSVDAAVFKGTISNKADLKILYDELQIDLPANIISNSEYAAALAKHVRIFYYAGRWQKGIEYAKKAMITDPVAYAENVGWDDIGTCRFKVNDYVGAIKDFERYLIKVERSQMRVINLVDPVIRNKAQAHLALGQIVEAAKTYEYYYTNYRRGLAQASVLYKAAGNDALAKSMLDMALHNALNTLETNRQARPGVAIDFVLDYAELLIIANRPADAIEALANYAPFTKPQQSIKTYLLATAEYLKDDKKFNTLKTSLLSSVSSSGKISNWDFELFNTWLKHSGLKDLKQAQLYELQNIAK